ncbi:hypothetical protein M9Y10_027720 [Tritrichomonas musculus]|uniref:DUF3447 domain-containing protein n=1 Tax=Tritrichomonas musculus TaxID=1915356 RepID=A0ABR2H3V8_9EUKA
MSIEELTEKMKSVQSALLDFLDDECSSEENYENFVNITANQKVIEDRHELKLLLRLINNIGSNHRRSSNFTNKIDQILHHFKKEIQNFFSNSEIFEVFKDNKRILLFLIEEKMMIIDEYVVSRMTSDEYVRKNYDEYFAPEIKPFLTKEFIQKFRSENSNLRKEEFIDKIKKEVPEEFYIKRKEGENENYLCELIRTNQVKEFGVYVNRNNISLESYIKKSIFETNPLLIDESKIRLIEYASFFGSIDIVRYMQINGNIELTSSMWIYAIHSRNAELIRYLEDSHVTPPEDDYETILKESIKCHHNDVAKYIIDYLIKEEDLQNDIESKYHNNLYRYAVEYYNYCFFPTNMKYKNMFFYLCEFDYYTLVNLYLSEGNIDINAKIKTANI